MHRDELLTLGKPGRRTAKKRRAAVHLAPTPPRNQVCSVRILIFDQQTDDRALLRLALEARIPGVEVVAVDTLADLTQALFEGPVDALVLASEASFASRAEVLAAVRGRSPAVVTAAFRPLAQPELPAHAAQDVVTFDSTSNIAKMPRPAAPAHPLAAASESRTSAGVTRDLTQADTAAFEGYGFLLHLEKSSAGYLSLPERIQRLVNARARLSRRDFGGGFGGPFAQLEIGMLWVVDGVVQDVWNAASERLLGRPAWAILEQPLTRVLALPEPFARDMQSGACAEVLSCTASSVAQAPIPLQVTAHPLAALDVPEWLAGQPWLLLLQTTHAQLEAVPDAASSDAVSALSLGLAHDIEKPVRQLAHRADWLRRNLPAWEAPGYAEAVADVADATQDLERMVAGVLDFGRASVLQRSWVNLAEPVEQARDALGEQLTAAGARVEIGPLPNAFIDPLQFRRVFTNLFDNSLKYSGAVTPLIRVEDHSDGHHLVICVCDNGVGVPAERAERIFETFARLHAGTEQPGVGLGLAIVRRIVEAHAGTVILETAKGPGACFLIKLPFQEDGL